MTVREYDIASVRITLSGREVSTRPPDAGFSVTRTPPAPLPPPAPWRVEEDLALGAGLSLFALVVLVPLALWSLWVLVCAAMGGEP